MAASNSKSLNEGSVDLSSSVQSWRESFLKFLVPSPNMGDAKATPRLSKEARTYHTWRQSMESIFRKRNVLHHTQRPSRGPRLRPEPTYGAWSEYSASS
ncbi:hypothetical protein VUR80DRAFT_4936 [Thermomyces stellatus]